MPDAPLGERLESWKEIAAYLKRDVRTARRWEKLEGLPVHRHVHNKLATVYAFKPELDGWRAGRKAADARPAPEPDGQTATNPRLRLAAIASIAVVAAVTVVFALKNGGRRPTPVAASDRSAPGRLLARFTGEGQQFVIIRPGPAPAVARLSPDDTRLYVADTTDRSVKAIDTATHRHLHSLPLPGVPTQFVISPDGRYGYVGTFEGDVLQLDLERRRVETLARGLTPARDLVLSPDGLRLFVTAVFNGLHVLDTRTKENRTISTVRCPTFLDLIPSRDLLYVSYQCGGPGGRAGHDAIDVRSATTGAAKSSFSGPPSVGGEIRASPDGAQVWVDGGDACVSPDYDHSGCAAVPGGIVNIYRTDDNLLLASLGFAGADRRAAGISFFRDGSRAIIGGESMKVVDVRSLSIVEEAPLQGMGTLAFSRDGRRAYLTRQNRGEVAVFDFTEDRCLPPPADLAAWWSGDGHANDIREDNPGEPRNGATFVPARVGQGFEFDGRAAYVHVANLTNVDMNADFSVAMWMKPAATSSRGIVLYHGDLKQPGWQLRREQDGALSFCLFGAGDAECAAARTVRSLASARAGAWTHVVATISGRQLELFLDGETSATVEMADRPWIAHPNFRMGGDGERGPYYAGVVDEVQIYRGALLADEVGRLFGADRFGLCYR